LSLRFQISCNYW